ncbi:MAG TPA: prepilin-type N-terminal cleavage/methylation domain-containing protein [Nodosilinea sp.]|nr:prepilin-type N-terminal cleavage/methylation domain-containing protein [Nodosilinea sp.]
MITKLLRHRLYRLSPNLKLSGSGRRAQEQGLTLIECLVAIVMVALVSSAIAPAMILSVATRVHSQKSEQALALAQSEIDSVRVLVERGGYAVADLPASAPTVSDKDVATAQAPDITVTDATDFRRAFPRDIDGDGQPDFLVQRFRARGQLVGGVPVAFAMGVRVYDRSATGTLSLQPAKLVMTSGDGGRSTRPLAMLYTTIATSNEGNSLCNLTTYFNSTTNSTQALPAACTAAP